MSASAAIPGLYYTLVRPKAEPSPLRTDVAGFIGQTLRGPVARPRADHCTDCKHLQPLGCSCLHETTRVEGWRKAATIFGGLTQQGMTSYALRGYFENGGDVAHVLRLLGKNSLTALATLSLGTFDAVANKLDPDWPGTSDFEHIQFKVEASSPGDWANDVTVTVRYWAKGASGSPEVEVEISTPQEGVEILSGISPKTIGKEVDAQSAYIRLTGIELPPTLPMLQLHSANGPGYREWGPIRLSGGTSISPSKQDYLDAIEILGDQVEVALVSCPDLYTNLPGDEDQEQILTELLNQAEELHDRMVLIDVPTAKAEPVVARDWVQSTFRDVLKNEKILRNGAVYHPRLMVPDPLGGTTNPLRCVPCCGLVAGVISRLDRQLGPYYTPANAEIDEAVDLSRSLSADDQAILYSGGLNILRCSPGQGLLVWGGRVLGQDALGTPVAHRRLIHLLVRAIHRVADPLVFDTNGPQLWLAFTRSITSVLLQAYRAGALKGARPHEAFHITCDSTTNPPEQIDQGMVVCNIDVAPAFPMEFIHLRVAVSSEGKLEVFES